MFANDLRPLVDETGTVKLARSYEPYGKVMSSSGSGSSVYAFAGEMYDLYTELIMLRSRWLSPKAGRFLTKDIWPPDYSRPQTLDGWNYVEANPINLTDPTGQYAQDDNLDDLLFGLKFTAANGTAWNPQHQQAVRIAAWLVGQKLAGTLGDTSMPGSYRTFRSVYGIQDNDLMTFHWNPQVTEDDPNNPGTQIPVPGNEGCSGCRAAGCSGSNSWTGTCVPNFGCTNSVRGRVN